MANERPPTGSPPSTTTASEDFAVVYREHAPTILRYVRRRLGDAAADDATAEVFSRAFTARPTAQTEAVTPLPWLYGIAANVIGDHHRTEKRRLKALERLAAQTRQDAPATRRPDAIDPGLARALRRLGAGDREALLLVAWGELSYEETAIALGLPVGTVRSRIHRARRQLDSHLQETQHATTPTSTTGEAHG